MARVDRNVLRLGTWELVHQAGVPRAVVLDEAVELAKAYGTDDSSAFVNGVLNKVADGLGRKDEPRAAG
jgi:N utilization substance protein B